MLATRDRALTDDNGAKIRGARLEREKEGASASHLSVDIEIVPGGRCPLIGLAWLASVMSFLGFH